MSLYAEAKIKNMEGKTFLIYSLLFISLYAINWLTSLPPSSQMFIEMFNFFFYLLNSNLLIPATEYENLSKNIFSLKVLHWVKSVCKNEY